MREPTEDDLFTLLADPSCPAVVSLRKSPVAARLVFVNPFLEFAESQGFARDAALREMDRAVTRLGGDRSAARDPTRPLRNLVRKARRERTVGQEEVWFLPHSPPASVR